MKHTTCSKIIRFVALAVLFISYSITSYSQGLRIYKNDGTTQVLPYESIDSIVGYDIPKIEVDTTSSIIIPSNGIH